MPNRARSAARSFGMADVKTRTAPIIGIPGKTKKPNVLKGDAKRMSIRDNMLVTLGLRAGQMEGLGYITLPAGANGEDWFAEFSIKAVDDFLANGDSYEGGFDCWIEEALTSRYGTQKTEDAAGTPAVEREGAEVAPRRDCRCKKTV